MKKLLSLLVILSFSVLSYAETSVNKMYNLPKGTFKKSHNGKIIQYDSSGKKVGVYRQNSGRYVKYR